MKKIMMLHGINHNLFGKRESRHYGRVTLEEINEELFALAEELGVRIDIYQTNAEHEMVELIHRVLLEQYDGLLINAGAWTHYSYGIRDALLMLTCPFLELHMSNIFAREEFRRHSVLSDIAQGIIIGLGPAVYPLGLRALCQSLSSDKPL